MRMLFDGHRIVRRDHVEKRVYFSGALTGGVQYIIGVPVPNELDLPVFEPEIESIASAGNDTLRAVVHENNLIVPVQNDHLPIRSARGY